MLTQIILRSMGFVDTQILPSCVRKTCLHVSMRFRRGWRPIVCSWIKPKPRSTSLRRQHQIPSDSIRIGSTDVQPVTSIHDLGVYINSTLIWPWGYMSQPLSEHVSRLYVKSATCSDLCHLMLCWPWSVLWLSARYCNSVLAGISCQLQDRLQTVLNAAAHLVFSARQSECITPLLRELHWLTVPKWVTFWLCVLAYRCLHGTAPSYLVASSLRTSDVDICHWLHSADSATLVVPSTRRTTLGDCAFPVAFAIAWNSLPSSTRNAPLMMMFRCDLKTVLFRLSFDLIRWS